MTRDESCFYLNIDDELIWLRPDEEVPERERQTVYSEKAMQQRAWNPSGFRLINALPKGFKSNTDYYLTQILGS
jgi:hypothetical protein